MVASSACASASTSSNSSDASEEDVDCGCSSEISKAKRSDVWKYFEKIDKQKKALWWKSNEHRFCQLASLARAVLCIPATSTHSERVFSTARITVNKLRGCLKPNKFDAIVFLNKNLKAL